nr:putative ribonuclease H-like domain-containing protein [Tanacetum cinerariifolium]
MAFISLAKHSRGNEEVNTASVSTASTNGSTASADIRVASISQDTACPYIASQSNGSQIKFEDINQIDEDDMEEMDIKWNMALLSMKADRFWKKTGKKISIQGTDVAGFDKLKVECFNCYKAPKALMVIDKVGWDWSYMSNNKENHALVANEEAPTEFSLMAKTSAESEVEARLAELRNQELKYCEKIKVLEFKTESSTDCIEHLKKELELIKKEKEGHLECADDTVTDYSRPAPTIESLSDDAQNRNPSEASSSTISPKSFIKFVKANDNPTKSKTDKDETAKKPHVKYAEQYRKPTKKPNPFDGGYVSFGQGGCKITGKGTIKTGKLEFENLYFVKDLKYNLFSVSQIYDNKNSVQFTNSECIVLGRDFKLLDDANVLLRTPRQHNMYSIDLNNIVPHKDLTCLVAKASADEGMLWHRRLGHLKFKTMNKLVRYNLVRGLPSKCFKNNHTFTACLNGKRHKASCKCKLVNSVTEPLHTLHMDLFGLTSDETSGILRKFITEIKNLKDLKVKIISGIQHWGATS